MGRERKGGNYSRSKFDRALAVVPRTTNTGELREVDCVIPDSDAYGQGVTHRVRISPAMESALLAIVQGGKWGYTNISQIIRHAILRHLEDLKEEGEKGPASTMLQYVKIAADLTRHTTIRDQVFESLDLLAQQAQNYLERDNTWEARHLLFQVRARILALPDSADRRKYLDLFDERFKDFMNTGVADQEAKPVKSKIKSNPRVSLRVGGQRE